MRPIAIPVLLPVMAAEVVAPCLPTMPTPAVPGNNESTATRRTALPDGDRRGAGICLTPSEFFTSRHGQFFIVCAELLDLF